MRRDQAELPKIEIRIVRSWDAAEIENLYRVGGWWKEGWDATGIPLLVRGSFAFAVAFEQTAGQAVGMGRVISDGISDAYLQDVVVDPAFRHRGIGCGIVEVLVSHCLKEGISWIGCIASPGSENFYRELGFRAMRGFTPLLYGGRGDDRPV
ncbi:MAG: GNAT family N-acetyltransferase [Methanomicrobiales archaeon]|nr:GNAT family N-acetyltransferase [Methanomicrobiales archaeon]